jgi:hypothetical protein
MSSNSEIRWAKRPRVHAPRDSSTWAESHAQLPTVDMLDSSRWRIYFASRDPANRANTTFIDVRAGEPSDVLYRHSAPILSLGKPGAFDSAGVMPGWIVSSDERKHLYYTGWCVGGPTPYELAIGLAVSEDDGTTWEKFSENPVLGLTDAEPYMVGSPCVLVEGGLWRCWYFSSTKWEEFGGRLEAVYHIKYAESDDGISWRREGRIAIDYEAEDEAIARGSVIRTGDSYRMWYAFRKTTGFRDDPTKSYRIGYAESMDGLEWKRLDDQAGIDVSENGWDSEMISYPYVFAHGDTLYMFYNGNGFGRTGFGYAVSE